MATTAASTGTSLAPVNNNLGTDTTVTESFETNPFAGNINPSTIEGSKLYLKATEVPPLNQRVNVSIETGHEVRNVLENDRSTFAWGKLIAKVPDAMRNERDIIKNYKCLSLEDCIKYANTFLGDGTLTNPGQNRTLMELDPANDPDHRIMFYKRVRSKMISQRLQGRLDAESWATLMTEREKFSWFEQTGEVFYEGGTMMKLIMDTCNPQTKVGVQNLRDKIAQAKSADFGHDVGKMMTYIKEQMTLIHEMRETHDSLLKDSFNAILTVPNSEFTRFFSLKRTAWQSEEETFTFDKLSAMAKTVYNNMVSNNTWNCVDPRDSKILALTTQTSKPTRMVQHGALGKNFQRWRILKKGDILEVDGEDWLWCELHEGTCDGAPFKGMYVKHQPKNHDKAVEAFERREKKRRNKKDKDSKGKETEKISNAKKLQLSKEMKAALLTVGSFTEEQAEAIMKEAEANLPEDF